MNDECYFYKEDECGPFTKPRILIVDLFSKNELDNNIEHHLSTIKIEKVISYKSTNWKRAYSKYTWEKVSRWGQNMCKTSL